jgi:prevent-host-death family protein
MTRKMTAIEVKAKLLALLDEVERGEEIEITRHGRVVARLAPARGPHALRGKYARMAITHVPDEELYSTGVSWDRNLVDPPAVRRLG